MKVHTSIHSSVFHVERFDTSCTVGPYQLDSPQEQPPSHSCVKITNTLEGYPCHGRKVENNLNVNFIVNCRIVELFLLTPPLVPFSCFDFSFLYFFCIC